MNVLLLNIPSRFIKISYSLYFIVLNSIGYIVPFLTISSILIDVCFTNVIFIGAIFNSYNYWSYSTLSFINYYL